MFQSIFGTSSSASQKEPLDHLPEDIFRTSDDPKVAILVGGKNAFSL
jgi:hypothetical protein